MLTIFVETAYLSRHEKPENRTRADRLSQAGAKPCILNSAVLTGILAICEARPRVRQTPGFSPGRVVIAGFLYFSPRPIYLGCMLL